MHRVASILLAGLMLNIAWPVVAAEPDKDDQNGPFAEQAKRMVRIMEIAKLPLERASTKHVTLIASRPIVAAAVSEVKKLETMLARTFPEPIASGVDPSGVHIVLLSTRNHYQRWVTAMFKVYEQDGFGFQGQDPLKIALGTPSFLSKGVNVLCLEGMPNDVSRRTVAFAVGYHYMRQLTDDKAPDVFVAGFGSYTEAALYGSPSVVLSAVYAGRAPEQAGGRWAALVKSGLAQGRIQSTRQVLGYELGFMDEPQYADGWSFTTFLASRPQQFAQLLTDLKKGEESAVEAIARIYALDDAKLRAAWARFAAGMR